MLESEKRFYVFLNGRRGKVINTDTTMKIDARRLWIKYNENGISYESVSRVPVQKVIS